ncbi:MAG: hypothetical protein Q8910_04230 [Bacteroidota bacterium]|nr:hypothetical protein [Bacteroidota bacterium]
MDELMEYPCKHVAICKHYEEAEEGDIVLDGITERILSHMTILKKDGIFAVKLYVSDETVPMIYQEIYGAPMDNEYEVLKLNVDDEEIPLVIRDNVPPGDFILVGMQTGYREP